MRSTHTSRLYCFVHSQSIRDPLQRSSASIIRPRRVRSRESTLRKHQQQRSVSTSTLLVDPLLSRSLRRSLLPRIFLCNVLWPLQRTQHGCWRRSLQPIRQNVRRFPRNTWPRQYQQCTRLEHLSHGLGSIRYWFRYIRLRFPTWRQKHFPRLVLWIRSILVQRLPSRAARWLHSASTISRHII